MILTICHETHYRYTEPLSYAIQLLRLTPRREAHQQTLSWHIAAPGRCHATDDAYGNAMHVLTITGRHDESHLVAAGRVQLLPLDRGRLEDIGSLPPLVYSVATRLTVASEPVAEFATRHLRGRSTASMLALAEAIRDAVAYRSGATEVSTAAADALALGEGVCQDHAHLFLACCRAQGVPARYVSGYIDPGTSDHADSHAWVDAWVEDGDYSGWVSIDVTHACPQDLHYCRLAVARDYDSAAPVRGVRRGGGHETLRVDVSVSREQ
ncbi:transglutaminase family protein [Noviherbaspirillum pedocola]|uniref:Transglutaminase family protein n=1 Tax=Noviherbaspirillum pedocola TaxID=2801341 RepID=A0A934STE5_9BURK|nr:transglutaminase family protein [Noviherbaspirillum pedocola]MBK4734883.1 transglutaminase family protein [Noviherbaspirillum pedocola]